MQLVAMQPVSNPSGDDDGQVENDISHHNRPRGFTTVLCEHDICTTFELDLPLTQDATNLVIVLLLF